MKRMFAFTSWVIFTYLSSLIYAQSVDSQLFGDRPPIPETYLQQASIESAKLQLKISPDLATTLPDDTLLAGSGGYVVTGVSGLDALNSEFKVLAYYPLFGALKTQPNGNPFRARHEAWELPLWFELKLDSSSNILQAIEAFKSTDLILLAEPVFRKQLSSSRVEDKSPQYTPNDPSYNVQWHYHNTGQSGGTPGADIDLENAWNIEKGHADVIVAIIDDAIQYDHPDLTGNMWTTATQNYGYNFVTNSTTLNPGNHGTHVAGTVSAETNNGVGGAGVAGGSGSNDGVRLMSCQVFDGSNNGGFETAPIWAADNGASISQNSWSYTDPFVYNSSVLTAIDYFNANASGAGISDGGLSIFSAGNNNSNDPYYPGAYSGSFSVAATSDQDIRSYYSNYASFHSWIDISAPGGDFQVDPGIYSTLTNSTYGSYQGTSMAAPHVSGVAALVLSYLHRNNATIGKKQLKELLVQTTDNHYSVNAAYDGKLGSGRLNAYKALLIADNYLNEILDPANFNASLSQTSTIDLTWTPNASGHDVMIIYSTDSILGRPVEGQSYSPGDPVSGGGTVAYIGSGSDHTLNDLDPATTYYFRAFSVQTLKYSIGINTKETTGCIPLETLPFIEAFETTQRPNCWSINSISGYGWLFYGYAYIENSNSIENASLTSPEFDFSGYSSITVSFDHELSVQSGGSPVILFEYSENNGSSWNQLGSWTSSVNPEATVSYPLPELGGKTSILFRWNYQVSSNESYWIIDDFLVTGVPAHTWTGVSSANWNLAANWSQNSIPTATSDVIIPNMSASGNPNPIIETGTEALCRRLVIETGGMLTQESGASFLQTGTLENNGSFVLQQSIPLNSWHYISSPVGGLTAGNFGGDYLVDWSEANQSWSYITSASTPLTSGKGFGLMPLLQTDYEFIGTPHTGELAIPLNHTIAPGDYDGFNLVGNPYPSRLDWSLLDDTYGAIYYWNGSLESPSYLSWVNGTGDGSSIVPVAQGFFVYSPTSGNLVLNNTHRTNESAAFYKTSSSFATIAVVNSETNDRLHLHFDEQASAAFEFDKDAFKLFTWTEGVSQIYSINNENQFFSIDVRPHQAIIQLGFYNALSGTYTLQLDDQSGFETIFLEDTKDSVFHPISTKAYSYEWDPTADSPQRFILHLNKTEGETETLGDVYAHQGSIYAKATEDCLLELLNSDGRKIDGWELAAHSTFRIETSLPAGIYWIRLSNHQKSSAKAVFIQP